MMVKLGWWLWFMSDFKHLPSQEEVKQYDPRWVTDMQLMSRLYGFQHNDSPTQTMFEQMLAARKQAREEGKDIPKWPMG